MNSASAKLLIETRGRVLAPISSDSRRRWLFERTLVHRFKVSRPFKPGVRRVLILASNSPICHSQIFPFFFYKKKILEQFGCDIQIRDIDEFIAKPGRFEEADIVFIQPWFRLGEEGIGKLVGQVRARCAPQRLVFLDSYAPTDLRFASVVNDDVDFYVKKHVLRDRSSYGQITIGDTNLTDYYGKLYGLDLSEVRFDIPEGFLDKLLVGPSFATHAGMLETFLKGSSPRFQKHYDVHARLACTGSEWYGKSRSASVESLNGLSDLQMLTGAGVSHACYMDELRASRICFSPFGYGEVAWRDYEAVACGALLLKPDMDHCETQPNIFIPGETYVATRWDFADVEEKVRYYLENHQERQRIIDNAFELLKSYFERDAFLLQMSPLFEGMS